MRYDFIEERYEGEHYKELLRIRRKIRKIVNLYCDFTNKDDKIKVLRDLGIEGLDVYCENANGLEIFVGVGDIDRSSGRDITFAVVKAEAEILFFIKNYQEREKEKNDQRVFNF